MIVLVIAAQKGGAGKTTLAIHLAVAAFDRGYRVALADLDPQRSLTAWAGLRENAEPTVTPLDHPDLGAWLDQQREAGITLAVIDTPPRAGAWAAEVLRAGDLVVIPVRPTALDLLALDATASIVRSTGAKALVVLSQVPPRSPEADDLPPIIRERNALAVAANRVQERRAYARALASGLAVTEFPGAQQARTEIGALVTEIFDMLNQPKWRKETKE